MYPTPLDQVMTAARLFHSTDLSDLMEEARLEAEQKRRKRRSMERAAPSPRKPPAGAVLTAAP
jgi:hypothetical protein